MSKTDQLNLGFAIIFATYGMVAMTAGHVKEQYGAVLVGFAFLLGAPFLAIAAAT